jgi:hypothetical protein
MTQLSQACRMSLYRIIWESGVGQRPGVCTRIHA